MLNVKITLIIIKVIMQEVYNINGGDVQRKNVVNNNYFLCFIFISSTVQR